MEPCGHLLPGLFEKPEQFSEVVDVWEVDAASKKQALESLFGCLLSVEAKLLEVNPWRLCSCEREIAAGAVQPLSRVIWREPLRRRKLPSLLSGQAE